MSESQNQVPENSVDYQRAPSTTDVDRLSLSVKGARRKSSAGLTTTAITLDPLMSRISKIPVEHWDPELREMTQGDSASIIEQGITRMLAHSPEMAKGAIGFGAAIAMNRTLPERLIELVRLRVAFHNQCRSCMAIRYSSAANEVNEELVCSLEKPQEAEDLTPAERTALDFADRFATDHLSITDERFAALREHFDEAQSMELMLHLALYVGMGRLAATLDMTEELPSGFQAKFGEMITPWADQPIQVR